MTSILQRACVPWLLAALSALRAQEVALQGNDPIEAARGKTVAGKPELQADHGGLRYRFATAANRDAFAAAPERAAVALDGACARSGPFAGRGDPRCWLAHEGRVYLFANDQARASFGKRPERYLAADEPEPETDAAGVARARELLERAAVAHGGLTRLRTLRGYAHDAVLGGEPAELRRLRVRLPRDVRIDRAWGDAPRATYSRVLGPAGTFALDGGGVRVLGADARRELERELLREPVLVLRAFAEGRLAFAPAGRRAVLGVDVDEVLCWRDGGAAHVGVDADGRVRTVRCRARGPDGAFGAVELAFGDFARHGDLLLPESVRGTFDGDDAGWLRERRTRVAVDGDVDAAPFLPPK
jgi:YHS domain-containing protein